MARWIDKWRVVAVNDAYKVLPQADALYACDNAWWEIHQDCAGFTGEKWSSHEQEPDGKEPHGNDKRKVADAYGVNLIAGKDGDEFSFDPGFIYYGSNSGFQAINLALLMGCRTIVLVGFDMRHVEGKAHYFGDHPDGLATIRDESYRAFVKHYERAAKLLPADVAIVNATPGSALTCFPMMELEDALFRGKNGLLHSDRAVARAV
jgi:hypothetical protein